MINSRLRFIGRSKRGKKREVLKMLMILGTDGGKGSKVTRD